MNGPVAVAVDHNRTAYVANTAGGNVTIYPYGQTTPNALTITTGGSPQAVAVDGSGTVYVADSYLNTVTSYPAGSSSVALSNPGPPFYAAYGVAVNSSGQVAIGDAGNSTMNIYAAGAVGGNATIFTLTSVRGDYYDRAGNLWIGTGTAVKEYPPGVTSQATPLLTITGFTDVRNVAVDIAGYVYVADYATGKVYVFAPTSATTATTANAMETITGLSNNGGIAVWPN